MHALYLPTIEHSLWPFAVLLVALVPVSFWHERNWRSTLTAYADVRKQAGAAEESWPATGTKWVLNLQPRLLILAAALLALMVALGAAALAAWPHRLPGFDEPINYFDRMYLGAMLVAGTAAVIGAIAVAVDLWHSPWADVANQLRRSMYVSVEERTSRFERALAADPGVPHVTTEHLDDGAAGASGLPDAG